MDILAWDLECYYDSEYTLSKLNTEAYCRDPRFELHLVGLKWNATPAFWVLPERFEVFIREEVDWANTILIGHHAHFDSFILSYRYGVKPAMHVDTLSMARILDGPKAGNSLHDLCIRHGVGQKGDFITFAKGKHLADFTRDELTQYGAYCVNDVERTYDLAQVFLSQMPLVELKVIDLVVRMFTEPMLVGDAGKLEGAVATEKERKRTLLDEIGLLCPVCKSTGSAIDLLGSAACEACEGSGLNKKPLNSNDRFANLLRAIDVEPETKTSGTTGEQIYAFAKTDSFMQGLIEGDDEHAATLAAARIAIKSNIVETRAARFAASARRGVMPVYLSYGAAHTFRLGGGDSMNWQNLSGHNEKRPEMSVIKASVGAPPGYRLVRTDSAQGEARIAAWNAGQDDLVRAFAQGRDVYSEHASTVFGRPVDRKRVKEDFIPGQIGKVSVLGMQYGMGYLKAAGELLKGMLGAPPIQFTVKDIETLQIDPSWLLNNPKKVAAVQAMPSRLELNDRLIHCIVAEALVQRYRQRYPRIPAFWTKMEEVINAMILGREMAFGANNCMVTGSESILMPNGLKLNYRGLQRDDSGDASYFDGHKRTKIHGPLLTENITQCLHYILVSQQMLEIADAGIRVVLMTHDDVVAAVPEEAAELTEQFMIQAMSHVPAWAAGLPLTGEGKTGRTLLEVK